jgi:hypothetical protein
MAIEKDQVITTQPYQSREGLLFSTCRVRHAATPEAASRPLRRWDPPRRARPIAAIQDSPRAVADPPKNAHHVPVKPQIAVKHNRLLAEGLDHLTWWCGMGIDDPTRARRGPWRNTGCDTLELAAFLQRS